MLRMPLLVLLVIGLAGFSRSPARLAEQPDLAGVYVCDGINPDGNPYRGIVEIVHTHNTFRLKWTFPQSNDGALGIGIISNGVLAVSYYGGRAAGIVVYKIEEGRLVGEWTVAGTDDGVYSETLRRLPGRPQAPDDENHRAPADRDHKPTDRNERHETPKGDPSKLIQG